MIPWREGHAGSANSAGIYGLVVSGSVMAAAGENGSVADVVVSVLVAVLVYWLAEAYAEVLADRTPGGDHMSLSDVLSIATHRFALVEASYAPLLTVVVARALGASTSFSVNLGLASAAVLLAIFGWTAANRRGAGRVGRVVAAVSAALFGAVMVALKTLLH